MIEIITVLLKNNETYGIILVLIYLFFKKFNIINILQASEIETSMYTNSQKIFAKAINIILMAIFFSGLMYLIGYFSKDFTNIDYLYNTLYLIICIIVYTYTVLMITSEKIKLVNLIKIKLEKYKIATFFKKFKKCITNKALYAFIICICSEATYFGIGIYKIDYTKNFFTTLFLYIVIFIVIYFTWLPILYFARTKRPLYNISIDNEDWIIQYAINKKEILLKHCSSNKYRIIARDKLYDTEILVKNE